MSRLATSFNRKVSVLRSNTPLSDEQICTVAPSIFAHGKHESRSERYAYIPTSEVLTGLRREGFQPFMACQARARTHDRLEHTKHMLRLRHASQITGTEANEIVLINSHDGSSAYQMLAGVFRFVCHNGVVCGDQISDIRIPHKGNVADQVIDGAFTVLDDFELIADKVVDMKLIHLDEEEQQIFARAALTLRYDNQVQPAPVTETQLLDPRRSDDRHSDLWTTFNRVQENIIKGGLVGRAADGKRTTTRPITSIDNNIKLNRALWVLAEEMRTLYKDKFSSLYPQGNYNS